MTTQENEIIASLDNNKYFTEEEGKCNDLAKKTFKLFIKGVGIIIIIMIVANLIYGISNGFKLDSTLEYIPPMIINMFVGGIGSIILTIYIIGSLIKNHKTKKQIIEKRCIFSIIIVGVFGPIIVGLLVFGGCISSLLFNGGF